MKRVFVKQTEKKGKGIFAARNFKKGTMVLKFKIKPITKKQMMRLSKDDKNHLGYAGEGRYFVLRPPERFLNHSCSPTTYDSVDRLIAMRNIKKGEEITIDYAIAGFDNWKMRCYCGSKNCRKIIHGKFTKLPKKLQKKYHKYLPGWYKKEFGGKK